MNAKPPYSMFPLSFAITGPGLLYLLAVLLVSMAIVRTSNNLLYVLLATMISAFVISSVIARNSLKGVSLRVQVPENIFAGERVPIKIMARNSKRVFPVLSVRVNTLEGAASSPFARFLQRAIGRKPRTPDSIGPGTTDGVHPYVYFSILRPGESLWELTVQSFPRRGLHSPGNFRLSTRFPFGLFRHTERIQVHGEVLVLPRIQEVSEVQHCAPFLPGALESLHKGHGEDLFAIRPYMEGESARGIDWKATAKTMELMGREFSLEEERRLCLILDTQAEAVAEDTQREQFEKAVSLAASIAVHCIEQGECVECLTPHARIGHGTGREHLYGILRLLATVECTHADPDAGASSWMERFFPGIPDRHALNRILSGKVFKIILTPKSRDAFPPSVLRSSHILFFRDL